MGGSKFIFPWIIISVLSNQAWSGLAITHSPAPRERGDESEQKTRKIGRGRESPDQHVCLSRAILVREARRARPEVRSSGFEVPGTSNFGPRTLARIALLSCTGHYRRPKEETGAATVLIAKTIAAPVSHTRRLQRHEPLARY
jgi:hypothetical protein